MLVFHLRPGQCQRICGGMLRKSVKSYTIVAALFWLLYHTHTHIRPRQKFRSPLAYY